MGRLARLERKRESIPATPTNTARATDRAIFGGIENAESRALHAPPISIFDILSDSSQPRRAFPSWLFDIEDTVERLDRWCSVLDEYAPGLWRSILDGYEYDVPVLTDDFKRLVELLELAASIRQNGLLNPITVARHGEAFIIETGERRWLSYHLLYAHTNDKRWASIPAQTVDKVDRFRQAAENTQRGDLTMVARARQWVLLLMAQHEGRLSFEPYHECPNDHAFYAQIGDLQPLDGAAILVACGVKSRAAIHSYRTVLKLTAAQWSQADDEGWSYAEIERALDVSNTQSTKGEKAAKNTTAKRGTFEVTQKAFYKGFAKHLDALDKTAARAAIDQQRRWLDDLERKLD